MTPSASVSPITLLTTVVDSANTVTEAATNPDGSLITALDGGFQLLIDAAAQQQAGLQLGSKPLKVATNATGETHAKAGDVGNALPLLGLLLPTDSDPTVESSVGADKSTASGDDSADNKLLKADDAAVQLLWVPVNVQPQQASSKDTTTADLGALAQRTGSSGSEVAAQPAAATSAPTQGLAAANQDVTVQQDTAAKQAPVLQLAADGQLPAPSIALGQAKRVSGERDAKVNPDVLTAATGKDTKLAPGSLELAGAAPKTADNSNFSDLVKAVSTPQSAANVVANAITAAPDTGRTQQSARPYLDINGASATVSLPVGSNGWSDAVVDKVMWFSAQRFSSAEIHLNPPDLGPLQVRISTQNDQASVVFSSPHAAVRDALDQALPRLRDMLGSQGIQLSDASVGGQGAQRQQQQSGEQHASTPGFFQRDDGGDTPSTVTQVLGARLSTSVVDAYV